MAQAAKLTPEDIDADSATRHFRSDDRPRSDFGLRTGKNKKPLEIVRAFGRARTRAWRQRNDSEGRPESAVVARALLIALAMAPDSDERLDRADSYLVAVMLEMLDLSGFSKESAKEAIRKFRQRVIDGRAEVHEADAVRFKAFDEFCERAESRARDEGFLD
jgi:hypothetical protein